MSCHPVNHQHVRGWDDPLQQWLHFVVFVALQGQRSEIQSVHVKQQAGMHVTACTKAAWTCNYYGWHLESNKHATAKLYKDNMHPTRSTGLHEQEHAQAWGAMPGSTWLSHLHASSDSFISGACFCEVGQALPQS